MPDARKAWAVIDVSGRYRGVRLYPTREEARREVSWLRGARARPPGDWRIVRGTFTLEEEAKDA